MTYQSINPFDGKTLKTFPEITDQQLEAKLATAAKCFETWKRKSYEERAVIIAKAAALMQADVDAFARPMTLEMGKRIDEARGEVGFSANILAYYAEHAETFLAPIKLNPESRRRRTWKTAHSACSSAWSPGISRITSLHASPARN